MVIKERIEDFLDRRNRPVIRALRVMVSTEDYLIEKKRDPHWSWREHLAPWGVSPSVLFPLEQAGIIRTVYRSRAWHEYTLVDREETREFLKELEKRGVE